MNNNEMIGAVFTASMALLTGLWFFVEKIQKNNEKEKIEREALYKKEQEYRERQLKETMRMNHELEKLNENLLRLLESDEKQNEKIEKLENCHKDLNLRLTLIEENEYIKDRR